MILDESGIALDEKCDGDEGDLKHDFSTEDLANGIESKESTNFRSKLVERDEDFLLNHHPFQTSATVHRTELVQGIL